MKKLSLLPLLLIFVGGVSALVANLFPDTPLYPRVPVSDGTLGGILSVMLGTNDLMNYSDDGTVMNTDKLGGISATGYLRHNECSGADVWLSVDTAGLPICGPKGSLLAVEIGTLTGVTGTVTIYKTDGSSTLGSDGDTLYVGDIISTALSSSGMITFTDNSLIRLGEDTAVELQLGENSSGTDIAQIILNDGDLWGRVLTTDGINIGAGGYIAGVRGTSLAVQKDGSNVTFTVVDSTIDTENAVEIFYSSDRAGIRSEVGTGTEILVNSGIELSTIPVLEKGKTTILASNEWARENTLADMEYLLPLSQNTTLPLESLAKIQDEFDSTTPTLEDTTVCDALGGTTASCSQDATEEAIPTELIGQEGVPLTQAEIEGRKRLKALRMICSYKYGGMFWRTRGQCFIPEPVEASSQKRTTIFIADYVGNTANANPFQINMPVFDAIVADPNVNTIGGTITNPIMNTPLLAPNPDMKGANMVIKPIYEKILSNVNLQDNGNLKTLVGGVPVWGGKLVSYQGVQYIEWELSTLYNQLNIEKSNTEPANLVDPLIGQLTTWYGEGFTKMLIKYPNYGTTANGGANWGTTLYDAVYLQKLNPLTIYPGNGVYIGTTGQYISYPITELGNIKGLSITINTQTSIPTGGIKRYLLDTGMERFYVMNGGKCSSSDVIGNYICRNDVIGGGTSIYTSIDPLQREFRLNLSADTTKTPIKLIIGNIDNGSFNGPISVSISGIAISSNGF